MTSVTSETESENMASFDGLSRENIILLTDSYKVKYILFVELPLWIFVLFTCKVSQKIKVF